jgi:hypothetical protein
MIFKYFEKVARYNMWCALSRIRREVKLTASDTCGQLSLQESWASLGVSWATGKPAVHPKLSFSCAITQSSLNLSGQRPRHRSFLFAQGKSVSSQYFAKYLGQSVQAKEMPPPLACKAIEDPVSRKINTSCAMRDRAETMKHVSKVCRGCQPIRRCISSFDRNVFPIYSCAYIY